MYILYYQVLNSEPNKDFICCSEDIDKLKELGNKINSEIKDLKKEILKRGGKSNNPNYFLTPILILDCMGDKIKEEYWDYFDECFYHEQFPEYKTLYRWLTSEQITEAINEEDFLWIVPIEELKGSKKL